MALSQQFLQQAATESDADVLREIIRFHEQRYYVQNKPLLGDTEYDALFRQLQALETSNPALVSPDSPTQRVGSDLNQGFRTVPHLVPMLSLDNSYDAGDIRAWDQRCRDTLRGQDITYCVEPKFDGASISLVYENDLLIRAVTRGNGLQGDDITLNARRIRNIPLRAPFGRYGIEQIEIRGEVLMSKQSFARFNALLEKEGSALMANPRNAASGSLRMKDPAEVDRRQLEAFLYSAGYYTLAHPDDSKLPQTHTGWLQALQDLGFRSPATEKRLFSTVEDLISYLGRAEAERDELPYEIDGLVIKINSLEQQEKLGMTSHHPRWAMAYKFSARQATTVLEKVMFQVGRTGAVTPVAKLRPIAVGGVTVSSISIHNEEYIIQKELMLGDTVIIERAGDVIPQIVQSLPELRPPEAAPIVFPTHCPVCSAALHRPPGEAVWRCINPGCEAQVLERIIHFVSRDAMDIRSLGEANIRRFYQQGWLKDIPGIYKLPYDRISGQEGFGKKSVENLKTAIEGSLSQPMHRLLYGMGIRYVGETTAKTLARAVSHLLDLRHFSREQLLALEDIGPKVAGSVQEFFGEPASVQTLQQLEALGLNLKNEQGSRPAGSTAFEGKTFLFTGTLTRLKRNDAEALVEARGGKLLSGVSSKLNYLVTGAEAGSKLEKAKKINTVQVLSETAFMEMMEEAAADPG